MSAENKVPAIRFKGFGGNISSRKLQEVVVSNTYGPRFNANDYDVNGNVKTIRGTDISLNGNILYNQVPIASLDTNFIKSHILEDGDLVMITTADCGLTGIFEEQNNKYICSAYAVKITLNKTLALPQYFKYFFQTTLAKNEVKKFIRKATVANLPASGILKITHKLPSKQEQEKIALFLTSLYKIIEQKDKKHQKLKQIKKALLKKMFPKQGATVPEIRFEGFSGEWEEKKLGQFVSNISDGDWIESNHIFEQGKYRIIQTGNLGVDGEYIDKENNAKYFHQKDFDEIRANEIFPGDILISRLAEPAGRTIVLPNTGFRMVTAVDVTVIRPDNKFNSTFLKTQLNTTNVLRKVNENVSGTSHKRISRSNLEKTKLLSPNLDEQTKIGNLFKQLDTLLTQHQTQLRKLNNIKQACLEKMFV